MMDLAKRLDLNSFNILIFSDPLLIISAIVANVLYCSKSMICSILKVPAAVCICWSSTRF